MSQFVSKKCQSCLFYLRSISRIRNVLTEDAAKTLIHAYVTSRIDYSNSLLYGIPGIYLARLQKIQNMAARIITKTPKFESITPILKNLHWIPVEYRIKFKILCYVYSSVNMSSTGYFNELFKLYDPTRSLRSSSQQLLTVQRCNTKFGKRAFQNAGVSLWNELPSHLKNCDTIITFKKHLKTYFYKMLY